MNLDQIMSSYLHEVTEKEKRKIQSSKEDRAISLKKRNTLEPVRNFLQKFVDLEVKVNHRDQYTRNMNTFSEPQKFTFEEIDSSKSWAPGISILINHPAEIEIAVPNHVAQDGVIIIKVATHHPDSYILEQKFNSIESVCFSLAKFLSKCTVSIGKDPSILTKDNNLKKSSYYSNTVSGKEGLDMRKTNDLFKESE